MKRPLGFELLLVTDPDAPRGLVEGVSSALAGASPGRVAVMLRAKTWPAGPLLEAARALRARTRDAGALFLVNDRIDVALAADADGVQLPEAGLSPAVARRLLGRRARLGASRHDLRGVGSAQDADFVLLAPLFAVPGKGGGMGLDALQRVVHASVTPIVALGGIDARHAGAALRAGARAVAVRRSVFHADDPAAMVRALLSSIDEVRNA